MDEQHPAEPEPDNDEIIVETVAEDEDEPEGIANPPEIAGVDDHPDCAGVDNPTGLTGVGEEHDAPAHVMDHPEIAGVDDTPEITGVAAHPDDPINPNEDMDLRYGARQSQYNLRPRKPRDYNHLYAQQIVDSATMANESSLTGVAFTQYNIGQGLKLFGAEGSAAVEKEMKQLDYLEVMSPVKAHMMTPTEKKNSLAYLMFLKQKRCGTIKARGCADGRKQRLWKNKEDTTSPTVAVESLFMSCAIDAKERRHVYTVDIPGAFMQADIDEDVYVRMTGPLARLLAKIDKDKYQQFICTENGKDVIYVKLKKALYGTLQGAIQFWKDLSSYLLSLGFKINPYDECVANKTVNGKQLTILWHVDDLKLSHEDKEVLEDLIRDLEARYAQKAPLTINREKVHDYLGMTIDYSTEGKVVITMNDYVDKLLADLPEEMIGTAATPASEWLYETNSASPKLDQTQKDHFHQLTARILFLSKRARPELQTALSYLTTRVQQPDEDDRKKLMRLVKYLQAFPHLPLTLEADDMHVVKWWVDASFAVHHDMKSHTGGNGSLGKGSFYSTSTRQKLNTRSSTEAELVGIDDLMSMILWSRLWLQEQGYKLGPSTIHQDNQSTMLMAKNGRRSSGKRTRHLNIRYYFVKDKIDSGDIELQYCPTKDMIADILTKPLQGVAFRELRRKLLNLDEPPHAYGSSGSQE